MNNLSSFVDPARGLSRRSCIGLLTAGATLSIKTSWAQPASEAAEEAKAPPLPALGSRLSVPPIALLGGGQFDPDQSRGRPLLVYWWSSTCPYCALQSPSMEALWRGLQARGAQLLTLTIDKKPEAAMAYLAKRGYTFPTGWASPAWRKQYPKPKGLPITLVADAEGRLVVAEKGQMFPEDVEDLAKYF